MKGKLNSEVYTPSNIVNRMLDLTDVTINGTTFCDPACGDGNILVEVIDRLKKAKYTDDEIIEMIYGYDIVPESVDKCKRRIADLLPRLTDINTIDDHIICRNTLAVEDIQKYTTIIMNPPYEKDLHKKFLLWAWDHATIVISIQPCQFLYKHMNLNKLDTELAKKTRKYTNDIWIMNPNLIWPDHKFASPVGIFYTVAEDPIILTDPIHVHDEMTDDEYNAYELSDFYKRHTQLHEFTKVLEYYLAVHPGTVTDHEGLRANSWTVELAKIRGHISETNKDIYDNDDFATMVMRDHKPVYGLTSSDKQCFSFDTETEAWNFINYLKTDFARLCLYINKHGLHLDSANMSSIPWMDFTHTWDDEILFNLLFTKNPKILPAYYN